MKRILLFGCMLLVAIAARAADLDDISNFRQYSDSFASSGQPTKKQLKSLESAGFERIVYIAYSDLCGDWGSRQG